MLKCEQVRPLLSEYIDRELTLSKMQMVKLHLKSCRECSRELALLKSTDKLLKLGKYEVISSDYFTEDVLARVSIIARNKRNHLSLFQRLIGKIKTSAVYFKYKLNFNYLSFVWKASFTLLLVASLVGLFSLNPFHKSDSVKNRPSVLAPKHKLIEVEFVQPDTQNHRLKKGLPSFDS